MDTENGAPNGANPADKARRDIGEVFEVWQVVHGSYKRSPPPDLASEDLANRIRKLGKDKASQLALAACWQGFADKVRALALPGARHMPCRYSCCLHCGRSPPAFPAHITHSLALDERESLTVS